MQELFRWLIDLSVIQLPEEKKLRKSDFITTENYHIQLKEHTAKALIEKVKLNMNAKTAFRNRNTTCQTILYNNVQVLSNYLLDKSKSLAFDVPTMMTKRNDNVDVQQCILTMTPAKRKRLGISKSGLWYQRKKLADGKMLRVYKKMLLK
jgi:CRISPR-associated protein Cas1